jgi:UPF0755 protein
MKKIKRYIFLTLAVLAIISVFVFVKMYKAIIFPNVLTPNGEKISLYIYSDDDFDDIKQKLYSDSIIINHKSFEWLAKKLDYPKYIKSGHYVISNNMNNNRLLNLLRSGSQTPVKFTFNNIRTIEQFAGRVAEQLEMDSVSLLKAVKENATLKEMGFDEESAAALFIPNTYELYWNIDADDFVEKMVGEYNRFWNEERRNKAKSLNMTPIEVSILASIVDKETAKVSEMPRIAGVYINRLKKNWLLQADPTLIFALGDFEIKRVLDAHKEIKSPYNTYKHIGLPPGPICIPSIAAIDAVLNAENHKYFYFCAKDDLSGYHVFARNMSEHNRNAEKYRKALNKMKIWK